MRAAAAAANDLARNAISPVLEDAMVLGSKTILQGRAAEGGRVICELSGIRSGFRRGRGVRLDWALADTLAHAVAP